MNEMMFWSIVCGGALGALAWLLFHEDLGDLDDFDDPDAMA